MPQSHGWSTVNPEAINKFRGKIHNAINTEQAAHICNYKLELTFRTQVAITC